MRLHHPPSNHPLCARGLHSSRDPLIRDGGRVLARHSRTHTFLVCR
jgi:hypothetical protein